MTYDELLDELIGSSGLDWLVDEGKGIFTLKGNLDVTIREVRTGVAGDRQKFQEDWAIKFPDPVAYRAIFEVWFRCSFVKSYEFASVDGGRALMPFPKAPDNVAITREQFAIADAVNFSGSRSHFEDYIGRFKIAE